MKKYKVFIIQGYDQKLDDGRLMETVVFEFIANTYEEALKEAKKTYKKPFYRLSDVIEKYVC